MNDGANLTLAAVAALAVAGAVRRGSPNRRRFVVRTPAQGLATILDPVYVQNHKRTLKVRPRHDTAVLLPCAGTKPFPEAPSHKHGYLPALEGAPVDTWVVAEPLGVIPYAWSTRWPNDAYDFPPAQLRGEAREALVRRIREWLLRVGHRYSRLVAALPIHHMRLVQDANEGVGLQIEDASISACRERTCPTSDFRATSRHYRDWLRAKVKKGSPNQQTITGYRVMGYDPRRHRAISGANSRISVGLIPGSIHRYPGIGMFLTPYRQYAIDYYANHDRNVLLTYEFDPSTITSGVLTDREPEVSVPQAKLIRVEILDDEGDPWSPPQGTRNLIHDVQRSLSPQLLNPKHPGGSGPLAGHCYVAAQALYHLMGGSQSSYRPQSGRAPDGGTHWWLRHKTTGRVLDPTASQYPNYDYSQGVGRGFLTKEPSRRARVVMDRTRRMA